MQAEATAAKPRGAAGRDRRKLKKTATPGVYKKGNRYVVMYWAGGEQHKESCATYEEARRLKRARETDDDRGEFQAQLKLTLHEYAREWVERYQGSGRRGFREGTRKEYRRLLDTYAFAYFPKNLKLTDVTPMHLARYVAWLASDAQKRPLSDSSIRNAVIPIRAMLSTAVREGLLRHNPATGLALPHREQIDADEEEELRAFSRQQLADLLTVFTKDTHWMLFRLMAATGLRISEALALRWRDLYLHVDKPYLRVRRAWVKGFFEPPKTKHGRRRVPLSQALVLELIQWQKANPDDKPDDLIFTSSVGTPIDPDVLRRRILKPAVRQVGAEWAGFHTFRHTYASLMFARGVNLLQLSRALGHHSPAFTLSVYAHLLHGEQAPPLDLDCELPDPEPMAEVVPLPSAKNLVGASRSEPAAQATTGHAPHGRAGADAG